MGTPSIPDPPQRSSPGLGPILRSLQLTAQQRTALRRQGFISLETRRSGRPIGKLRFRCRGRQIVRYLGVDAQRLRQARQELQQWQAGDRSRRQLTQAVQDAAAALRIAKQQIEPYLSELGLKFHGHAIRRSRAHVVQDAYSTLVQEETNDGERE